MTDINSRMIELVRRMADTAAFKDTGWAIDARAIVAELDGPSVSEDLKAAREAAASVYPHSHNSALILDGERDGTDIVRAAVAAIAKGRELAINERQEANEPHPMFVANVGNNGVKRINSVAELLRLINGGAKITNIQQTKSEPVRDITDKWDEIGLGDDISLDDQAKPAKETRAEFEDRNKDDPLCGYGGYCGY